MNLLRHFTLLVALGATLCGCAGKSVSQPNLAGEWRALLTSPGVEIPFGLRLSEADGVWSAFLLNGPEAVEVPRVEWEAGKLVLAMDHYDSIIEAEFVDDELRGSWHKQHNDDHVCEMQFRAQRGRPRLAAPEERGAFTQSVIGRWHVQFETEEHHSVGIFETDEHGKLLGTFLNATGDYRFLEGREDHGIVQLSCFDGAHAFYFRGQLDADGKLQGDFWSRDHWHESWTAHRDEDAALPDGFALTSWTAGAQLSQLSFPDMDGTPRSLDDPAFGGRARILYVFGTWCPNCHDATELLVEFHEKYGEQGLSILGLAFEHTKEFARSQRQLRHYTKRFGVEYPVLIGGYSDKAEASLSFPLLDRVRSYPTTIFIDAAGEVRAIHSGFTGPAAPAEHAALRAQFTEIVEEMLSGAP